ncbi:GDP-mannose 4,6-dehydratase [Marinospirillum sp.]|uniref:dTDP-glucose 4,6-dehydratase n=1 Tax=Marinospirillum sp. TaxID=2183934 RepID=UPI0028704B29|nr:GDP-mannose 4,6-dehydratase [Marinospirillum sp.]MDR9469065.1 GDP-mannose 4,6-dehydratase [Marinospirillum sp.]
MKLLITGGSGFIGSAVIHHLLRTTQYEVLNYDKLTSAANPLSLQAFQYNKHYRFVKGDICDPEQLEQTLERFQPDAVINCATLSPSADTWQNPTPCIKTNYLGNFNLLEAVRAYWQELTAQKRQDFRFLHLSTEEVFGHPSCLDQQISEATPYAPDNPYSASKATADQLFEAWQKSYELPILITHASRTYGPRQAVNHFLPRLLIDALLEKPLPLKGDSQSRQDWLHIEDHVCALLQILERGQPGETYNISSDSLHNNHEVLSDLCQLLDELEPKATSYLNLIDYQDELSDYPQQSQLDSRKLRNQLGWKPLENLHSGLRKTLSWYLANPEWVKNSHQRQNPGSRPKPKRRREVRGT